MFVFVVVAYQLFVFVVVVDDDDDDVCCCYAGCLFCSKGVLCLSPSEIARRCCHLCFCLGMVWRIEICLTMFVLLEVVLVRVL